MKIVRFISRVFVGLIFIYSGFVKAVDPLGSTYKFIDYFEAFGTSWANNLAFILAIVLAAAEFVIGVMLLLGIKKKLSAWGALLFMSIFTPLTLYLALENPVTDCGCFGDALILTNWQTFWKNIIIFIPVIIFFAGRKKETIKYNNSAELMFMATSVVAIMGVSIYCYRHLPIIDFRPYHVGANIKEGMELPPDAKQDKYELKFWYKDKKTGEVKEFNENNYPWEDTINWEFVDSKSELLEVGDHPAIHDFSIENNKEGDITEDVLDDDKYVFLLVAYDLKNTDIDGFKKVYPLAEYAQERGYRFICLTSSLSHEIDSLRDLITEEMDLSFEEPKPLIQRETVYYYEKDGEIMEFAEDEQPDSEEGWDLIEENVIEYEIPQEPVNSFPIKFYNADEITLKTIVRANPGLVLLKKVVILRKWHYSDMPDLKEFQEDILLHEN